MDLSKSFLPEDAWNVAKRAWFKYDPRLTKDTPSLLRAVMKAIYHNYQSHGMKAPAFVSITILGISGNVG